MRNNSRVRAEARHFDDRAGETGGKGFIAFMLRPLLANPKDALAILIALAMTAAIAINALFMQAGRHPSPMFGQALAPLQQTAHPIPRARPIEASTRVLDQRPVEKRSAEPSRTPAIETRAAEAPRAADQMGQLVARTTGQPLPAPRPPAPIPAKTDIKTEAKADPVANLLSSQRRVAAVQRALTEFGYGQLKPTGTAGTETQAAIARFEKERKLPVTGQVTDRMVRELSAVTGRPIE